MLADDVGASVRAFGKPDAAGGLGRRGLLVGLLASFGADLSVEAAVGISVALTAVPVLCVRPV